MSVLMNPSTSLCHAQEPACMALEKTSTPPQKNAEIALLPAPNAWPAELNAPRSEQAIRTREQLGLPTDRPIIASGHQPILFHPGIVAKLIALDHWSKKTGAAAVWVVPDQDVVDPGLVRLPKQDGDSLIVESFRIGGVPTEHSPAAVLPAISINADIPKELESTGSWLMGYEYESSIARQFARATIGMLCKQLDLQEPALVFASDLLSTDAGTGLLDAMLADPKAAIESYNASVDRFPNAGVRQLSITETRIELPLWRLAGDARLPVYVNLKPGVDFDRQHLIPRGLMMTAIMRAFACDLFIHGTGGYNYDQITEAWFDGWQGQSIAPIAAASATMRLGFEIPAVPDPDRAVWAAHHARHDPAMLGDESLARQKSELVAAIADSKSKGTRTETAKLFAQLQQLLVEARTNNAQTIKRFDAASRAAQESRKVHAIVSDRTWAFPLYTDQQMQSLKDAVIRALGGGG